ncbi:ER membrane glycoprotein subunit of the GPI transamidase complex-like protein [Aspergillus nanangensis]|uniref:GPI mannosyltransferase 2 n=1 Tax=Aspergillus nanangensis TaxID=2582783 RepID=A0AAD4GU07_ASPNN|nr:ER membrane glycoprotein subunit of the GPI transamidase complex-like protein [Aspergillus nanangensis]
MVTTSKTIASPARFLNPDHPIRSLSIAFWVYKSILLLIIACSPGPGYDTSTALFAYQTPNASDVGLQQSTSHPPPLPSLLKFVRWDAIYYVHTAENGYVYEQEWAFGYGYSRILALLTSVLHRLGGLGGVPTIALVAVVLSHVAHYLSVLALYRLSANVFGLDNPKQKIVCFLSAALHIISPAGAFLSAPYGEALFSFLNITGFYAYSSSLLDTSAERALSSSVKLLLASGLFSVATTVRSNGVISGFLYAYDAVLLLYRILTHGPSKNACIRLIATIIGGCVVGFGMILPQAIAYADFCLATLPPRPWCEKLIPSIYGWGSWVPPILDFIKPSALLFSVAHVVHTLLVLSMGTKSDTFSGSSTHWPAHVVSFDGLIPRQNSSPPGFTRRTSFHQLPCPNYQ